MSGNSEKKPPATLTPAMIAQIPKGGQHLSFRDADYYDLDLTRVDFDRCQWENLRLKSPTFHECSLTRSKFINSYVPNATFDRCDLTGTTFDRCYMRHASFDHSKLWYVEFHDCELDYDNLISNAPHEVNLRRRLLHNLRLNALSRREFKIANELLAREMVARRQEDKSILLASTDYFRDNFSSNQRLGALARIIANYIDRFLWGYGVRLRSLLRSAALVLLFFSVVIWAFEIPFGLGETGVVGQPTFWDAVYVSTAAFSTLGGFEPGSGAARLVSTALSMSGAIFLGLFAAAAFRRIER